MVWHGGGPRHCATKKRGMLHDHAALHSQGFFRTAGFRLPGDRGSRLGPGGDRPGGAERRNFAHRGIHSPAAHFQGQPQARVRSDHRREAVQQGHRNSRGDQPGRRRSVFLLRRPDQRTPRGARAQPAHRPSVALGRLGARRLFHRELRAGRTRGRNHDRFRSHWLSRGPGWQTLGRLEISLLGVAREDSGLPQDKCYRGVHSAEHDRECFRHTAKERKRKVLPGGSAEALHSPARMETRETASQNGVLLEKPVLNGTKRSPAIRPPPTILGQILMFFVTCISPAPDPFPATDVLLRLPCTPEDSSAVLSAAALPFFSLARRALNNARVPRPVLQQTSSRTTSIVWPPRRSKFWRSCTKTPA